MPRGRIAMESIEEILRLHHQCEHSQREVAHSCGLSAKAVSGLLRRAAVHNELSWRRHLTLRLLGGDRPAQPDGYVQIRSEYAERLELTRQQGRTAIIPDRSGAGSVHTEFDQRGEKLW